MRPEVFNSLHPSSFSIQSCLHTLPSRVLWLCISFLIPFLVSSLQQPFTQSHSQRKIQAGGDGWRHLGRFQGPIVLAEVIALLLFCHAVKAFGSQRYRLNLVLDLQSEHYPFSRPTGTCSTNKLLCSPAMAYAERALALVRISQAMNPERVPQGKHRLADTRESCYVWLQ